MLSLQLLVSFLSVTLVYGRPGRKVKGLGLPISNPDATNIITNKYIVVYHNNITDDNVQTHQQSVMTTMTKRGLDTSACRMLNMSNWRAMSMGFNDDSLLIDVANSAEVSTQSAGGKWPGLNEPNVGQLC